MTGSGRGLGRIVAERLLAVGAGVAVHDISEEAPAHYGEAATLSDVAAALSAAGGSAIGVTGDISDEAAVAAMVARVEAMLGPISILVNCAGGDIGAAGTKPSPNGALDIDLADATAVLQRNFIGTMLMCRAVGIPAR